MRDVKSRIFIVLALPSLLLCATTVGLWVRSYLNLDKGRPAITGDDGYLDKHFRHEYSSSDGEIDYAWWPGGFVNGVYHPWYRHGFGFQWDPDCLVIILPHWFIASAFASLPLFAVASRLRNSRITSASCCPKCQYDVRATPDRCPECGTRLKNLSRWRPTLLIM